jgi:hypothetical protein
VDAVRTGLVVWAILEVGFAGPLVYIILRGGERSKLPPKARRVALALVVIYPAVVAFAATELVLGSPAVGVVVLVVVLIVPGWISTIMRVRRSRRPRG